MDRRHFLKMLLGTGVTFAAIGLVGCGREEERTAVGLIISNGEHRVVLYDTNAMALYMDGSLGPKTGVITVDYVKANQPVTLDFWHGHNGVMHQYTVTPSHFAQLKQLRRVTLETTEVADHTHKLFIDMADPKWRVPGAKPVVVPDGFEVV
jgi:hypothetical protein